MIRRQSIAAILLCGLSLAVISCKESKPIESMFSHKELIAESHFGFSKPRVSLVVESRDKALKDELEKCLSAGLRAIPGVTLATSDPLYRIEVLALPVENDVAVSVAVVEISSSCRRCLMAHHILYGEKKSLEPLCRKIFESFEKKLVAPFRKNET
jgi:hypothetical protein